MPCTPTIRDMVVILPPPWKWLPEKNTPKAGKSNILQEAEALEAAVPIAKNIHHCSQPPTRGMMKLYYTGRPSPSPGQALAV